MFTSLFLWQQKAWEELKKTYGTPPSFINKAGRDLSQNEGRDIVMHLVVNEQVLLIDPPLFTGKGVEIPAPGKRYKISNKVAGVTFKAMRVAWDYLPNVNLAWIVVLSRLASGLRAEFGTKTIYWGGIGVGGDAKAKTDSHHTGRAIDFFGADTRDGKMMVTEDWSKIPIVIRGKTVKDWPASQIPYYRLWPVIHRGYYLFEWVYDFATRECQDYSTGASIAGRAASRIGQHSFIIHPDHPNAHLRHHHQDHMHFQIGTT